MNAFAIFFIVVPDDELDIDALDGFVKGMCELHPKSEGENLECFCGDVCKMEVSDDYKTLWQQFLMCNNLTYDPEPDDTEVPYNIYYKKLIPTHVLTDFYFGNGIICYFAACPPPSLCDYKVWIDIVRGLEVISYICLMARLNMMEGEFCAPRMEEGKHAT
jgi:hypothetical protein